LDDSSDLVKHTRKRRQTDELLDGRRHMRNGTTVPSPVDLKSKLRTEKPSRKTSKQIPASYTRVHDVC